MNKQDSILDSWNMNAKAWVQVLDADAIASRKLATNAAIIKAILDHKPASVMDIGCGEGWLCRKLAATGIPVTGVDGVADLIEHAQERGGGVDYLTADYQKLVQDDVLQGKAYDLIICNFSLFDETDTAALLSYLPAHLTSQGRLLIHTLHPDQQPDEAREHSGWREERWAGLEDQFSGGYHWYYRSLADWKTLFTEKQLSFQLEEIPHPETGLGLSMIFFLNRFLSLPTRK